MPGPVDYEVVERRVFGLTPLALVAGIALGAALAGLTLLAAGLVLAGLLLLAAAALLAALYVEQARHRRETPVQRATAGAVDRSREVAGLARVSAGAWGRAGRSVARARLETKQLERERRSLFTRLGEAVHRDDEPEAARLRDQLRLVDERIAACAARAERVVEAARRRTSRERLATAQTEIRRPG